MSGAHLRGGPDEGMMPAVLLVQLALLALFCLALSDAANVIVARTRAQAAADAAALAAAAAQWSFGGRERTPTEEAAAYAESHGGRLDYCGCDDSALGAEVLVSVATRIRMLGAAPRRVSARARAELEAGRMFEPP